MSITRIQGLTFPIMLSSGSPEISDGDNLIISSIKIILAWPLFTREYIDDFGSRIYEALEDQNDNLLVNLVSLFIITSINKWETRIELKRLSFERPDNTKLIVNITYIIKDINTEETFPYIFYTNQN